MELEKVTIQYLSVNNALGCMKPYAFICQEPE